MTLEGRNHRHSFYKTNRYNRKTLMGEYYYLTSMPQAHKHRRSNGAVPTHLLPTHLLPTHLLPTHLLPTHLLPPATNTPATNTPATNTPARGCGPARPAAPARPPAPPPPPHAALTPHPAPRRVQPPRREPALRTGGRGGGGINNCTKRRREERWDQTLVVTAARLRLRLSTSVSKRVVNSVAFPFSDSSE